nr:laccase domain-containing protein [Arthrobacter sp. ATA002]
MDRSGCVRALLRGSRTDAGRRCRRDAGAAVADPAGHPALDLPAGAEAQLAGLGVAAVRVDGCTLESADLYSHRRTSSAGRFAGLVWLS